MALSIHSVVSFAGVYVNLVFQNDHNYDHCIGELEIGNNDGLMYREDFFNPSERDTEIAKAVKIASSEFERLADGQKAYAVKNGFPC